ncbi:MAG: NAD(P)/FAD-dependent oxidoreductase [Rubrobacteraceae bacterium]|nr:NAD(P)/FAD-dependent oxidoreductase [Rubrobacteraceae bacterium]
MSGRRVVILGAGPGGVAAARRLRERTPSGVEVVLVERPGGPLYLPGTIPTLLGEGPASRWRAPLALEGVEVVYGEARGVSGSGVRLEDEEIGADAVVAAPGLALDLEALPSSSRVFGFWDPEGAQRASEAVRDLEGGVVAVVISSLPYRCPPAPYGMAMQLANLYRSTSRPVRVVLTTPEEEPLQSLGQEMTDFLRSSCSAEGVEILTGFEPDLTSLGEGTLRSADGRDLRFDLALVVPPHRRSPLLAHLPGGGPLVEISRSFETTEENLFVIGDAAATALPRTADGAAAAGRTAADAILERFGILDSPETHLPAPECFVGHGSGRYSHISLRYPDGLPPQGRARVTLEGPSTEITPAFERAFENWRSLRS